MLGLAEGVFELTLPYIAQRKQFGKPVAEFQGMQFLYASLATGVVFFMIYFLSSPFSRSMHTHKTHKAL
jgi:alkylation response protein AidB-like acyl-CoA dehydrogenase